MKHRFRVVFRNNAVLREYQKLDGTAKKLVVVGINRLRGRADEIGQPLSGSLAGCKKLKWRKEGLRLVFRILDDGIVEIVEIIAIGKREKLNVYRTAEKRLSGDRGVSIEFEDKG